MFKAETASYEPLVLSPNLLSIPLVSTVLKNKRKAFGVNFYALIRYIC